jgi:hypothetical protein
VLCDSRACSRSSHVLAHTQCRARSGPHNYSQRCSVRVVVAFGARPRRSIYFASASVAQPMCARRVFDQPSDQSAGEAGPFDTFGLGSTRTVIAAKNYSPRAPTARSTLDGYFQAYAASTQPSEIGFIIAFRAPARRSNEVSLSASSLLGCRSLRLKPCARAIASSAVFSIARSE